MPDREELERLLELQQEEVSQDGKEENGRMPAVHPGAGDR